MIFGYLIPRKIIKFVATICQILRLKMHHIQFRLGLPSNPAGEAYSVLQTS